MTNKAILLLFLVVFIFNLFAEIVFLFLSGNLVNITEILLSIMLFPLTILLGTVVDNLLSVDQGLFAIISIGFYPTLVALLIFKKSLVAALGKIFPVVLGCLLFLATIAPLHRLWAMMSV